MQNRYYRFAGRLYRVLQTSGEVQIWAVMFGHWTWTRSNLFLDEPALITNGATQITKEEAFA